MDKNKVVLSVFLVDRIFAVLKELIMSLAEEGAALTIGTRVREIGDLPGLFDVSHVQGCDQFFGEGVIRAVEGQIWVGTKHRDLINAMLRDKAISYSEVFVRVDKDEVMANIVEPLPVTSEQASIVFIPREPVDLTTKK